MSDFSIPIRVYVEDTDAGGIVYYVNYLKYMERARTELLRSLGYEKPAVFREGLMFVVKSVEINYLSSAQLDDRLLASARIMKVGRASLLMKQEVFRANGNSGEPLCGGVVKIACITHQGRLPAPMPEEMYRHLQALIQD